MGLDQIIQLGSAFGGPAASILSGIGSLFGASSAADKQLKAQRDANKTNLQMTQMNNDTQRELTQATNAANYRMFQESNAFTEDMWNKTNSYNDPTNQVARLRAAGINPAAVFGNGTIADAGSVGSSSYAPAVTPVTQAGHVNPEAPDPSFTQMAINGASDSVNAFLQSMLNTAEIGFKNSSSSSIDKSSAWIDRRQAADIASLQALANSNNAGADLAKFQLNFEKSVQAIKTSVLQNNANLMQKNIEYLSEQITGQQISNRIAQINEKYADQLNEQQLANLRDTGSSIRAGIELLNSQKNLTDQAKLNAAEELIGTRIENGLQGLDFLVQEQIKDDMVQMYKNQLSMSSNKLEDYDVDKWFNRAGSAIGFGIGAFGGYAAGFGKLRYAPRHVKVKGFHQ